MEQAVPTAAEVKRYFDVEDLKIDSNGVSAMSLYSKSGVKITEIPFKLYDVGTLDIEHYVNINTFNNFPDTVDQIIMDGNKGLKSLEGAENIKVNVFDMKNSALTTLAGAPNNPKTKFSFNNSKGLTSTGSLTQFEKLILTGCPNITDFNSLLQSVSDGGEVKIEIAQGMPLVYMVLTSGTNNHHSFTITSGNPVLNKIVAEFMGGGLSRAFEMCKRLMDQDLESYANLIK